MFIYKSINKKIIYNLALFYQMLMPSFLSLNILMSVKGAGIFVIENYKNNLVAVLFGKHNEEYSDLGGVLDPGEKAAFTACREAREESANLIKIEPNELKQIAIPINHLSYRSYVIYVTNLNETDYQHNIKKILKDCKQHAWKENDSMTRILLDDLLETVIEGFDTVHDINDRKINIRARTIAIVKTGMAIFKSLYSKIPHKLYQNVTLDSKMNCLIGTYTYTLSPNIPKTTQALPLKRSHRYAIYVVPNLKGEHINFNKCNELGGLHVTLVGFSADHPQIKQNLEYLSQSGNNVWKINKKTMRIDNNALYFDSETLNKAAKYLARNSFQKVKGKKFSGIDWHLTINCPITENIINVLKKVSWSFVAVRENIDQTYTLFEKYIVKEFDA
jgi:hypothetical protein